LIGLLFSRPGGRGAARLESRKRLAWLARGRGRADGRIEAVVDPALFQSPDRTRERTALLPLSRVRNVSVRARAGETSPAPR